MTADPILHTTGLTKHFGGVEVLCGIDFAVGVGELRCLIGPNGAGKSTFFKCITGQIRPSSGGIEFKGEQLVHTSASDVARRGMGIKTQVPSLYDRLTVNEHIRLAANRHFSPCKVGEVVRDTLDRFAISHLSQKIVGQLAHGQRQAVEIAMVSAAEPDLILLDEPAAGMTHEEVKRLADILKELAGNHTLVIVEHDMQFIQMIAHTVTVLHRGRVLLEGSIQEVLRDKEVRDVYLGRSK